MQFLTYTLGMCRDFETMTVRRGVTLAWLALLLCSSWASAATVYKTVDENGVVSFSDTAPVEEQAIEIIQIDARTPESSESAQEQCARPQTVWWRIASSGKNIGPSCASYRPKKPGKAR